MEKGNLKGDLEEEAKINLIYCNIVCLAIWCQGAEDAEQHQGRIITAA